MKRRTCLLALMFFALVPPSSAQAPKRLVSLVPAATEMLFAMGDGPRIVGVSNYDTFPPEATRIRRVGGLIDPDVERIFALRPDLVIVYNTQVELKQRLDRAGVAYYSYEHRALADITATVRAIGRRIGSDIRAEALASEMERGIAAIRSSVAGRPRPRTLLIFERDPGSLRNISASGGYGFLHDMLEVAGGDDVLSDIKQQMVQASTEMILTRRPDVIVELRYGSGLTSGNAAADLEPWKVLASVPAVRNGRIHVLRGDEFVVPGPRIVDAAGKLADALHPERSR
jgi:iron complex transport system substrate-binding protein